MAERKFTTMFFLVSLLVFLSLFITMWAYNIYVEKASYATNQSKTLVKCSGYSFEIKNIAYSANSLSFDVENEMGEPFSELVVEGTNSKTATLKNFNSGITLRVKLEDIQINKTFKAYPNGCKDESAKTYKV